MSPSLTTHSVPTASRTQMLDVTDIVRRDVREQRLVDGIAVVYVPHTTAAVTINENADPAVQHDMLLKLNSLIPKNESGYRHSEGNSDSHVKTSLVGNSVIVLIERGQLVLGQWQGIFLCEFDGPRQRQLLVRLVDFNAASRTAGSS